GEIVGCTTSPSTQRSLNSSPDWMCAASRVTTWPTRTTRLGALEILTRPRVHFDLVAALDEERNVHAQPRLDGRGLRRAGGGVAFQPEVRVGDLEHHRGREIHPDRRPFVLVEHRGHPVGEVVDRIAELILVQRDLVVARGVHEVEMRPVLVHVLHVPVIQARPLETIPGLERALDEIALANVAQLDPNLRAARPELDVLEFDDLVERAVELDGHAALDLTGGYQLLSFGGWGAEPPTFASSQRRACSYPTTPRPMN